MKPEPNFLVSNEKWIFRSIPIFTENLWLSQVIKAENKMKYFDLISNFYFNLEISINYMLVLSFFSLILLVYSRLNIANRNDNYQNKSYLKKLIYLFTKISEKEGYSSKCIWIFFGLFIWLTQNFIFSNFKTSQILVNILNFLV